MKLTFLGATDTVTGSKYLLEASGTKLLVDCGLFQGYKNARERNWQPLPIPAKSINAVLLTHAHIDHSGYLPLLVKQGFSHAIYATAPTKLLCEILLPDSGYLQEEEAMRANKYGYSKHKPALPLYTKDEAIATLSYFKTVDFDQMVNLKSDLSFTFKRAGHILGASMLKIQSGVKSILFSGDLGRCNDPVMHNPDTIKEIDYLVIESTYGNREHGSVDPLIQMEQVINNTIKKGGSVLIPAFAVGRAQTILFYIQQLKQQKRIADIPVFLDSPMAQSATDMLVKHHQYHKLSANQAKLVCDTAQYVRTVEESKHLNQINFPAIIISASGMVAGGRVLHHMKKLAPNHRNAILFAGFQAGGTRGHRILSGEKKVKIHGEYVDIKATVYELTNMSSHADSKEILKWLENLTVAPRKIFITHGEPDAADALRIKIQENFGWTCVVPEYKQTVEL